MIKIQEKGGRGGKEVSFMKVLTGRTKGLSNRFCATKFETPAGNLSSIVCSILHSQKNNRGICSTLVFKLPQPRQIPTFGKHEF